MKKSLKHLPKLKTDELKNIVNAIRKSSSDVEMIILFGSYARGDYKEKKDLNPKQKSGHISDYDILVVTAKKKSTNKFSCWNGADNLNPSAIARVIAHDIETVNKNLAEGHYIFTDIKKEGIMLFDSGKYKLSGKKKLSANEKQKIAKAYFNHWFGIAEGFMDGYKFFFRRKQNGLTAFHLHQAAEHAYKAILLVFTNYNPQEHYLEILGHMTNKYHPELKILFPKKLKKDQDRFDLLDYAYIGGRYDLDYHISKEDLEILAKDVKKLLEITKEICTDKIKNFK